MQRRRFFNRRRQGFRASSPMQAFRPPRRGTPMQGRRASTYPLDSGAASASSASATYDPSVMESAADVDAVQSAAASDAIDTAADATALVPVPWYSTTPVKVGAALLAIFGLYRLAQKKKAA